MRYACTGPRCNRSRARLNVRAPFLTHCTVVGRPQDRLDGLVQQLSDMGFERDQVRDSRLTAVTVSSDMIQLRGPHGKGVLTPPSAVCFTVLLP